VTKKHICITPYPPTLSASRLESHPIAVANSIQWGLLVFQMFCNGVSCHIQGFSEVPSATEVSLAETGLSALIWAPEEQVVTPAFCTSALADATAQRQVSKSFFK
jgi:hypothetical protein